MEDYPPELRVPPLLLAGLVGATQIHGALTEALHDGSLDTYGQRRVKYISFSYDMRVPPCKRGGKDVPGYRVGGILKRRWLEKVCNQVPAVLVVCVDWSEDLQHQHSEEVQAVSRLQHAQRQARDRDLRVLVFAVLHEHAPDPDVRTAAIRQQLEGTGGGLIVAKGIVDLRERAKKLERLVYSNAMSFYADEEKRQRKVWNPKPLNVQLAAMNAMQVRVHFKLAFLSEFRGDTRSALTNYIKAYEQLQYDPEIADVIERISLCNHITLRMYQRYLLSNDLSSAVHHCKAHCTLLRHYTADTDGIAAWRKWRWLASNHQLFAEMLENVMQHNPLTVQQGDSWQSPGFHYQCAASYAHRLKQWARSIVAADKLPPPSDVGGDLVQAEFLGQAEVLERPDEVSGGPAAASAAAAARGCRKQAYEVDHGQACLHLLTRAQAAAKEKGHHASVSVATARIAEEYLEDGNFLAAGALYERLRRGRAEGEDRPALWPRWPELRRFALERCILCACRRLAGADAVIPAVCSRSRHALEPPTRPVHKDAGKLDDGAPVEDGEASAQLRRQLVLDAFEYLALAAAAGGPESGAALPDNWRSELLTAVSAAAATSPDPVLDTEIALDGAIAEVAFPALREPEGDEGATEGEQEEVTRFNVALHNPLRVVIDLREVVAVTTCGDVKLEGPEPGAELVWQADSPLELRGAWPKPAPGACKGEDRITSLRLSWGPVPGAALLVHGLRPQGSPGTPLLRRCCPLTGAADRPAPPAAAAAGLPRPLPLVPKIRAETFLPVDACAALVSEPFVFHVFIYRGQPLEGRSAPAKVSLHCTLQVQEDPDHRPSARGDEPAAFALAAAGGGGEAQGTSAGSWALLPLSGRERGQVVAEVLPDGTVRAAGPAATLPAECLIASPPGRRAPAAADKPQLCVPVVVRCGRDCRATVALRLDVCAPGSDVPAATVSLRSVSVAFCPALQVQFGERPAGPGPVPAAPSKPASPLRRFTIRALTPVTVELSSVEVVHHRSGPDTDDGAVRAPVAALGLVGRVARGAAHVFALPPGQPPGPSDVLAVSFRRDGALAAFFPWADGRVALAALAPGLPPLARAEWPLPRELASPGAASGPAQLSVELDHDPSGVVASGLEVRVRVTTTLRTAHELKVRLLQAEASADGAERYFVCGPTGTQAVLAPAPDLEPGPPVAAYTLVPLRAGPMALPRVQVTMGELEATSPPGTVFVFPSPQPVVPRGTA